MINPKYSPDEIDTLVAFVERLTDGGLAHLSLSTKLQQYIDKYCDEDTAVHCKSGEKLVRLGTLLSEAIRVIEEECLNGKSLKGTHLQQEIGITDDEYDENL